MVVIKRSIRATSVPVGRVSGRMASDESYLMDIDSAAAARRITTAAFDDTDAMLAASRRHDQQLLDDINAKLANASFSQPVTVKRSTTTTTHVSPRPREKPPLPTTVRRFLLRTDDEDVDEALTRMPATPVTASVIRSSSVPPRLPRLHAHSALSAASRGHVIPHQHGVSHVITPHHHGVPVYEKVVHESRVTNHPSYSVSAEAPLTLSLTPVADLAVRQAHRNLDRIDKEINLTYAYPDGPHKFSSKAYVAEVQPVVVRRSSVRVPSTFSGGSVLTRRTSSVSPSRARSVQLQYRAPSPSPSASDLLLMSSSVSPSPPVLPVTHAYVAAPSVSELQHQMKVDLLKTSMMDTESPLLITDVYKPRIKPALPYSAYVTPRSAHVTTRVITTPVTVDIPPTPFHVKASTEYPSYSTYASPRSAHVTTKVITAPVTVDLPPAPIHVKTSTEYSTLPQPTSVRPKVSETRRKVREVLCKIKKDPHYFD